MIAGTDEEYEVMQAFAKLLELSIKVKSIELNNEIVWFWVIEQTTSQDVQFSGFPPYEDTPTLYAKKYEAVSALADEVRCRFIDLYGRTYSNE